MTPTIDLNSLRASGLWPHQAEFIIKFLQPDSAPVARLMAPAGTGKTRMATDLISLLVRKQGALHILVLAPSRILIYAYERELNKNVFSMPVLPLDKKRIRLIESDLSPGESLFLQPLIALSTFHQTYDERIGEALLSTAWDLIIIDEAHFLEKGSKQAAFTKRLLDSKRAKRFLLLSGPDAEAFGPFAFPEITTIEWKSSILDWEGNPPFFNLELDKRVIQYERSQGEIKFLTILQNYEPVESDENRTHFKKSVLLRLASSSLYAIEQSLLRQSYRMLRPPEQYSLGESIEPIEVDEQIENEIESSVVQGTGFASKADESTRLEMANLIELLEQVPEDTKIQALIKEISSIRDENPMANFIILSSYAATVGYLASVLDELDLNIAQISGSMSQKAVKSARNEFVHRGGILVASTIVLEGLDLGKGGIDVLVFYDLPSSNHAIALRTKIALTQDSRKKIRLYTFEDTSGALPYEATRLNKFMTVFDSSLESNEEAGSSQRDLFEYINDDLEH